MLTIRPEMPDDAAEVRAVNEAAFGGTLEAELIERLRVRRALTISLVALQDGQVVGHIAFSLVAIESADSSFEAITLAPVAVLPAHQRQGVGGRLVRAGLQECQNLGHDIVVVVGHPTYYPRFGFVPAREKGIGCEVAARQEACMVLELREGALAGRGGTVRFQPEFKDAV